MMVINVSIIFLDYAVHKQMHQRLLTEQYLIQENRFIYFPNKTCVYKKTTKHLFIHLFLAKNQNRIEDQ
jgi:hypothetical protein